MIAARETHLDALAYRLGDPGIKKVIETIITGESDPAMTESEPFRLCMDLGLVVKEDGTPSIANPIYREIIARQMTYSTQDAIPRPEWEWEKPDGSLDMDRLLKEFQKFWRKHSEVWEQKSGYTEAFPHLLVMAFLQRVLNGGGRIEREYAAGRGCMDLAVEYKGRMCVIEIKLIHYYDNPEEVGEEGLEQIRRYCDRLGGNPEAYLLLFDRREETKNIPWDRRLGWERRGNVTVLRC
jgi:hypothetical protein